MLVVCGNAIGADDVRPGGMFELVKSTLLTREMDDALTPFDGPVFVRAETLMASSCQEPSAWTPRTDNALEYTAPRIIITPKDVR